MFQLDMATSRGIYFGKDVDIMNWEEEFKSLEPIKKKKEQNISDSVYKNNHPHVGLAVVICNENFGCPEMKRTCADNELGWLMTTFQRLQFHVFLFKDLTANQAFQVLEKAAKSPINSESDTIAIFIASHGLQDLEHESSTSESFSREIFNDNLIGTCGGKISTNDIINLFQDHNSIGLNGKPRLFFFQVHLGNLVFKACRSRPSDNLHTRRDLGAALTMGSTSEQSSVTETTNKSKEDCIWEIFRSFLGGYDTNTMVHSSPIDNHFAVVQSSFSGKQSYSKEIDGGWLVTAFYLAVEEKINQAKKDSHSEINLLDVIVYIQFLIVHKKYYTTNFSNGIEAKCTATLEHKLMKDVILPF